MKTKIANAIERYLAAVGEYAMAPSKSRSTVTPNGTVILRNVSRTLAIVTTTGKIFDRIGGERLDEAVTL